jgi:hypothetical protein
MVRIFGDERPGIVEMMHCCARADEADAVSLRLEPTYGRPPDWQGSVVGHVHSANGLLAECPCATKPCRQLAEVWSPRDNIAGETLVIGDEEEKSARAFRAVPAVMLELKAVLIEDYISGTHGNRPCESIGRDAKPL